MVEALKIALEEIKSEKGSVTLFAIMRTDDLTDKWSVIFSAPWIKENNSDNFGYLLQKINKVLSAEESASIARIGIFVQDHYLVKLFLRYQSGKKIENEQVNGFFVKEAYIIASYPQETPINQEQIPFPE